MIHVGILHAYHMQWMFLFSVAIFVHDSFNMLICLISQIFSHKYVFFFFFKYDTSLSRYVICFTYDHAHVHVCEFTKNTNVGKNKVLCNSRYKQ